MDGVGEVLGDTNGEGGGGRGRRHVLREPSHPGVDGVGEGLGDTNGEGEGEGGGEDMFLEN